MKYEIQTMEAIITEDNMSDIREILFGEPYDVISVVEGGELIDDEGVAFEEFKKCRATARKKEDGSIKIRIPELIRGEEELDGDISDESGDEVYLISEYEAIARAEFDEEALGAVSRTGLCDIGAKNDA